MSRSFSSSSVKPLIPSGTLHLHKMDIPDSIYNCIISFLQDRLHVTRYWGCLSGMAYINASTVHGPGIGSTAYDISASDLHPADPVNRIAEFADDSYLVVGSSKRHTIAELDNVDD